MFTITEFAERLLEEILSNPAKKQFTYSTDPLKKHEEIQALQELIDAGYIVKKGAALGFMLYEQL